MPDIYLFPEEPIPADVRLREPSAPAAVHTVEVAATATALPTIAFEVTPASIEPPAQPPPTRGGGIVRPRFVRPQPVPVTRQVHVAVRAHCKPTVALAVEHAGRRHQEDELILVGAL